MVRCSMSSLLREKKNARGTYYYYMSSVTIQRLAEIPTHERDFRRGVDGVGTRNLFVLDTALYPLRCVGRTTSGLLLPLVVRFNLLRLCCSRWVKSRFQFHLNACCAELMKSRTCSWMTRLRGLERNSPGRGFELGNSAWAQPSAY